MDTPKIEGLREELREARKELARVRADKQLKARIKEAKAVAKTADRAMWAAGDAVDRAGRQTMKRLGIRQRGGGGFTPEFLKSIEEHLGITQVEDQTIVSRTANRLADLLVDADAGVRQARRDYEQLERLDEGASDRLWSLEGEITDAILVVNTTKKDLDRAIRAQETASKRRKPPTMAGRIRAAELKLGDIERGVTDPRTIWKVG